MRIVALAGGIGGARFLQGLKVAAPDAELTVVVNTGDDITLYGLRVCPDLDSVMYTLGGGSDTQRGWGRQDETFRVKEELVAYDAPATWFGLGDLDMATHLVRRQMLDAGFPLSAVTAALCERWRPGARLLPMSDDRVETHVVVDDDATPGNRKAIHFQEWWVKHHAALRAHSIVAVGAETATPAPGVLEAIEAADVVLLPPSNPVVSIGTILQVKGIRDALAGKKVVGLSPIIGGAPVRGMADACLDAIGVETSAQAVGRHYGSELLAGWLVDTTDAGVTVPGVEVRAVPLLMTDVTASAAMATAALELAGV
ncbi:MAG: domain protein containing protein [Frankiales bacterium]|jgi:LPPG:FO 2-phospho-L-lactate transferase|nr:domain protein containing protein [Frankiales bacterium]